MRVCGPKTWARRALLWGFLAALGCGPLSSEETESSDVALGEDVLRDAKGTVSNFKTIRVEGIRIATWDETFQGRTAPFFAIDLGRGWNAAKETSYDVPLRARQLDPLKELRSTEANTPGEGLHVVQYVSQPLEPFWRAITAAGGEVHQYLHGNSQLVRANGAAAERIAKLAFVRAVTPLHGTDKIERTLARRAPASVGVNVVLVDARRDRSGVEDQITALGGRVTTSDPAGILIKADVPAGAVEALSASAQVLWIEESAAIGVDYDVANDQGGASYLQAVTSVAPPGYTGVGIRGHILEGIDPNHPDFAANAFRQKPIAVDAPESDSHGIKTFGVIFGSGAGNARARGLMPNGQGYYTHLNAVFQTTSGRATLTAKMIREHKVMFQTASWGTGLNQSYTAESAALDALIAANDIPITTSQSNFGTQVSRPEAWAKNVISVGAVKHFGTLTPDDDRWDGGGSIGPAADGSIKPDLCFYFDKTISTALGNGYTQTFGGTSGATPTVAGHVGLTIELWTNGVFGNALVPRGPGEDMASFRFKNRPHFTTTKALLIHSARQYAFEGENHDLTRTHQGWGMPNLSGLYDRRANILVVNETDVLRPLEQKRYSFVVPNGAPDFRATMVYADKEATLPTTIHRVNNLDLRVTTPDGTVYWGNAGLKAATTSTPGGAHDVLDTVENVFVKAPAAGTWTIDVIGDEINADMHLETPALDADYALVVSTGR